ncbi:hypothetical protein IWW35_000737 [Coemansia sp. RSA 1878]|nr:hypothetical protein IWW35_000737 [Coemansia sp. RSA 1878]
MGRMFARASAMSLTFVVHGKCTHGVRVVKWIGIMVVAMVGVKAGSPAWAAAVVDAWLVADQVQQMLCSTQWIGQARWILCTQWIEQVTYHWVYGFLRASLSNVDLELPQLPRVLHPATTLAQFNRHWQHEVAVARHSLFGALFHTFSRNLAVCSMLQMLVFANEIAQPALIAHILHELAHPARASIVECTCALAVYAGVSVVASVAEQNYIDLRDRTETAMGATLVCAVHQAHALSDGVSVGRLEQAARMQGTDVYSCGVRSTQDLAAHIMKLTKAVWVPVRVIAGVYVFYRQVGWAVLPGIAAALLYLPARTALLRASAAENASASHASSQRIELVTQLIEHIVPIRMLGLTSVLARQIQRVRNTDELEPTMRDAQISLVRACVWTVCRTGGPLLSLFIYSGATRLAGSGAVTAERVFIVQRVLRELFPLLIDAPHAFDCWWAAQQPYLQIKSFLVRASLPIRMPVPENAPKPKSELAVSITRATFTWPCDSDQTPKFALADVDMHVCKGQLVAVVGKVGAGKSSLLSAILGEMDGSRTVLDGRVALVSQTPWMMTGSVRDNITFGLPYEAEWFHAVLSVCALELDISRWVLGEHTAVGANGMALSGGQRMRVALARAVYSRASIYLLDNVLDAVDVHVSQRLLDRVLVGPNAILHGTTRIVVTKDPVLIRAANMVYTVCDGRVSAPCTQTEFIGLANDSSFASEKVELSDLPSDDFTTDAGAMSDDSTVVEDSVEPKAPSRDSSSTMDPVWYMLRLCGKSVVIGYCTSIVAQSVTGHQAQFWLAQPIPTISLSHTVWHFVFCASWWAADVALESGAKWWASVACQRTIFTKSHDQLLSSIVGAPLQQFSRVSTGHILAMFTQGQHDVDTRLPAQLTSIASFVVKIGVEAWIIATFHPLLVLAVISSLLVMFHVVRVSTAPLESVLRAGAKAQPLVAEQFQESVSGAVTIRAFEAGHFMQQRLIDRLAQHAQCCRASDSIETWIDLVMSVIRECAISVAFAIALTGAALQSSVVRVDPTTMALVQASTIMLLGRFQHTIRHSHLLRTVLRSSADYVAVTQLDSKFESRDTIVPQNWPAHGAIVFENVSASYCTDTDNPQMALHNVSFSIKAGQHVGIVGRTGSGKTSIAMALFGLLSPVRGRILVDGIDMAHVPLSVLHDRFGVVPQSTYVLPGSVRNNIDPHGKHTDDRLQEALRAVGLVHTSLEDMQVGNWSVGQRQLLALARALVRNVKILVLDEATASMDTESSSTVHKAIRTCFQNCTVITIAHRLESVMDCHSVLVVRDGSICEHGVPAHLAANKSSVFAQMLRAANTSTVACSPLERVELFWDIGTLNISRDGYSTWKSMCVNNAVPIPPVHVTQGDVLVLNVRNSLNVPTAVHAHGIYHNYTDYYDGAEMVTECGIPPGENFTYIIDTTTQAGNFWLHSHVQSQLTDGLRTPFIVHEKIKPSTYDEEKLLYFEDWDTRSFDEESIIHSTLNVKNIPTAYRMLLINGMNGNVTQPVVFVPGKRYRVRVVSLLTVFWLKFRIPGHTMQIIDQDGVACNPVEVDGLDMGPGQRFSILVTAHDTVEYNYKYNVTLYADFFHPSPGIMPRYYSGLIEYQKNASLQTIPAVSDDQLSWSNTLDLQARDGMPLLPVDRQIVLTVKDYFPELDIPYYTFGDYAYNHTLVPTLFTALTMGDLAFNSSIYGLQSQAHVLHYGESIEVLIYSDNINDHSLHMHAGEYQVVEVGPYGDAAANNRTGVAFKRSGPAPMRCDEVTIRSYSYIKLRFRVNHGAIIFFHCHMIHNFKGLAVTFIAAPDLLQKHMKVPNEVIKMCKLQNIKTSGNAAGNAGFDLTGLPPPFLVNRE